MDQPRTFSKIVLALHMPESEVKRFLLWLDLHPKSKQLPWKHVAKPNANLLLNFGRGGLRRVKADKLIEQLLQLDYRYHSCVIALKPDTYTKKEARATQYAGETHFKEGEPKLDECGRQSTKFCFMITFDLAPSRPLGPEAVLLAAMLQPLVWRRGRAIALWDKDGVRSSLVELVGPGRSNPRSFTELHFKPPGMFVEHSVLLP